jgi:type IV pilus assembly protein PilQ
MIAYDNSRPMKLAIALRSALVILLHISGAALATERPVVREVLVTREGNGARIDIRADQPLANTSYLMPELAKWVVDLPGAKTTYSDDESKQMRTPPLERITVRQKEVNGELFTRIGLDVKGEVDFSLREDPLDKGHLVVSLTPAKATPQKMGAEASPVPVPQPFPKEPQAASDNAKPSRTPSGTGAAAKKVSVRITADAIRIEADGKLAVPAPLLLNRPGRLVLDLSGVIGGVESVPVPANRFGIVRSRLGKSAGKLRIVFEVTGNSFPDFQVKEIPNGVEILPAPDVNPK